MKKLFITAVSVVLILVVSCAKPRTVVVPEACATMDKTVIPVGDTLTITNCGFGELIFIIIFDSGHEDDREKNTSYTFDSGGICKHVFRAPGKHVIKIRAMNDVAPMSESRMEVEVTP